METREQASTVELARAANVSLPVPLCCARSYKEPLHGQSHRSSGNFSTRWKPSGTTRLLIQCHPDVTFDVKEDKRGTDPVVWRGLRNGALVDYENHENLYIADPHGAQESFDVEFWVR